MDGFFNELHPFGREVGDDEGNELQGREGDLAAEAGFGLAIPEADLLAVIVGEVGSGERGRTQITTDVLCGRQSFGIEAIRVDLKAPVLAIEVVDRRAQVGIVGAQLAEPLADEKAPFGGELSAGHVVQVDPGAVSEAAFGHDQMNMRLETQVAAEGVDGVDHADLDAGVELSCHLTDGFGGGLQQDLQQLAVVVKGLAQFLGDVVDPFIRADFAARGAKARLAGKGDDALVAAAKADVAGVAGLGIAAAQHLSDDVADVGVLVGGEVSLVEVKPTIPVVEEGLAKAVAAVGGWGIEKYRRGSSPSDSGARNEPDDSLFP